jgi:hypothetical protein
MAIQNLATGSNHLPNWPQELSSFNDRDIKWCYNFFIPQASNVSKLEKEGALLNFFIPNIANNSFLNVNGMNQQFNYNTVIGLKQGNIVDLAWIDKKDGRLLNWLMACGLSKLTNTPVNIPLGNLGVISVYPYPFIPPVPTIPVEQQYDFIVEYIDSIRFGFTDATHKQSWLNNLKDCWLKVRTPAEDIKWLEQSNEEQLLWAWKYLQEKSNSAFFLLLANRFVPPPANNREYYNAILASLDAMTILDALGQPTAEKQLFIAKFKKAWSQRKFRAAGKTKKPYHLPLTIKTKECLEKLAQVSNRSESEVLERLINEEYVRIFLDSTGREKY